jgi:hypothetical protein
VSTRGSAAVSIHEDSNVSGTTALAHDLESEEPDLHLISFSADVLLSPSASFDGIESSHSTTVSSQLPDAGRPPETPAQVLANVHPSCQNCAPDLSVPCSSLGFPTSASPNESTETILEGLDLLQVPPPPSPVSSCPVPSSPQNLVTYSTPTSRSEDGDKGSRTSCSLFRG